MAPLHRRAWVFQEQVLAPRILHFNVDQLYWECRCALYSQNLPWGIILSDASVNAMKSLVTSAPDRVSADVFGRVIVRFQAPYLTNRHTA